MNDHLTKEDFEAYEQMTLPADKFIAAQEHLQTCTACAAWFDEGAHTSQLFNSVRHDLFGPENLHFLELDCLTSDEIYSFVNQEPINAEDFTRLEAHVECCESCEQLVSDLRQIKSRIDHQRNSAVSSTSTPALGLSSKRSTRLWLSLAAATILIIVAAGASFLLLKSQAPVVVKDGSPEIDQSSDTDKGSQADLHPPVQPPDEHDIDSTNDDPGHLVIKDGGQPITIDKHGRMRGADFIPEQYRAAVRELLTSGRLQVHQERFDTRPKAGTLLGPDEGETFNLKSPINQVVLSDRPRLTWDPVTGADYYVVVIQSSNGFEIESEPVTHPYWTPPVLPRGRLYSWAVEAVRKGERIQAPAPNAGRAQFRIVSREAIAEISLAKKNTPVSRVVLALLYARYGLSSDAGEQLRALREENPDIILLPISSKKTTK